MVRISPFLKELHEEGKYVTIVNFFKGRTRSELQRRQASL